MRVTKYFCDFCKAELKNPIDYTFPYLGGVRMDPPTHSTINLCNDCIDRIKELRQQLLNKDQ